MRKGKPAIGSRNMRKVTSSEAKLLGLDKKLMVKIMIMTDDNGKVTFWLPKNRSNEIIQFTGTVDEYFDDKLASQRLEEYWSRYGREED